MRKLKYKIGDTVITNSGEVVKIIDIDLNDKDHPYKVDDGFTINWYCSEGFIRPLTKLDKALK